MRLNATAQEALAAIQKFQGEVGALKDRLAMARAWYARKDENGRWLFGPSKFVGYHGFDGATYIEQADDHDGRKTEVQLREWFDEVPKSNPLYTELHTALSEFLAHYGKTPSKSVRISVLKEAPSEPADATSALMELIVRVADLLSPSQRAELKKRIV
jgi:hypothetical protein